MNAPLKGQLNQAEANWLQHMIRFGSEGYPVRKLRGGRWIFDEFFGVKGTPTVYKTKREAVAAIERYEDVLVEKAAGRWS